MTNKTIEQTMEKLPEIQIGKGIIQNEYHEFDVFDHTLAVVEAVKTFTQNPETIVAAYLHDIGKPPAAKPRLYNGIPQFDKQGRARHTFPNHEIIGAEMVRGLNSEIFNQYNLNQENIAKLVEHHYTPMKRILKMRETKNISEFLGKFKILKQTLTETDTDISELMNLFAADTIGKGNTWGDAEELLEVRKAILGENNLAEIYQMQKLEGGKKWGYSVKE